MLGLYSPKEILKIHPTHMHTPMHIHTHPPTTTHTRAQSRTATHTRTHTRTPHTYPLMPADALNVINHMKLRVNGKMADDT